MVELKLKILKQIEEVKKEVLELDNKNIELIKKRYGTYWKQIAKKKAWKKPYSEYHCLQIKLKTLQDLLFAKVSGDEQC